MWLSVCIVLKPPAVLLRYVLMSLCGRRIFVLWSAFSHEVDVLFLHRQIGFRLLYYFFPSLLLCFISSPLGDAWWSRVPHNIPLFACVNRLIITIYTLHVLRCFGYVSIKSASNSSRERLFGVQLRCLSGWLVLNEWKEISSPLSTTDYISDRWLCRRK
jgi:hypothetical protein